MVGVETSRLGQLRVSLGPREWGNHVCRKGWWSWHQLTPKRQRFRVKRVDTLSRPHVFLGSHPVTVVNHKSRRRKETLPYWYGRGSQGGPYFEVNKSPRRLRESEGNTHERRAEWSGEGRDVEVYLVHMVLGREFSDEDSYY